MPSNCGHRLDCYAGPSLVHPRSLKAYRMPVAGPSTLSLIAAALYAMVVVTCVAALVTSLKNRQVRVHWQSWAALALLFAILVGLRLLNAEEIVRGTLREWLLASESYEDRRGIQGPIVLAIVAAAIAVGFFWIYRRVRDARGRRNYAVIAAQTAGLTMMGLIALRIVSFSAMDKLLFGPLKLNWIGDLGSSAMVAACAIYYVMVVRKGSRISASGSSR